MIGLVNPTAPIVRRKDAYLNRNGYSIMNASVMYYGGAKTGKTRLLISAFSGSEYIFLDFDRNYESTIKEIEKSGAMYFNGASAYDVLFQLMNGTIHDAVVVVDALGSIVKPLCRKFMKQHIHENNIDEDGTAINEAMGGIGINHADTVTFFNHIIEPMTQNRNSINFIHHTTQNMSGEKMEGNQGSWLSVFDFTYGMDRETKTFKLRADRLPIAPHTVGEDNVYQRINKILQDNKETIDIDGVQTYLTPYKKLNDNKTVRLILNQLIKDKFIRKIKISRKEYLDSELIITNQGQCKTEADGSLAPKYKVKTAKSELG